MNNFLKDLIYQIEEKKNKLDSLRPLSKDLVNNLDNWFKIELTYTSNALEGNTLTRAETALVVEKGLTIGGKSLKEHLEAKNLAFAIDFIKNFVNKKRQDLKEQDILKIHYLILKNIDDNNAGIYRKVNVKISGSTVLLPEPLKVPELLKEYMHWLHSSKENILQLSADAHYRFVKIHPFVDGNGRTARLILNILLMQEGYPPALISKESRLDYVKSLDLADNNIFDSYYEVIFKAILSSLDIYLKAI